MKKLLTVLLVLSIALWMASGALAQAEPQDIKLTFQGAQMACRPIVFAKNDMGQYVLVLYEEGLDEFVTSQRYNVMAPVYACILSEQGAPMMPARISWSKDVKDCCFFFYGEEAMPGTLSLVPLDSVKDTSKWHTLTLAGLPSQAPETYTISAKDWNCLDQLDKEEAFGSYACEADATCLIIVKDAAGFELQWGAEAVTGTYAQVEGKERVYQFTAKSDAFDIQFTGMLSGEKLLITGDIKLLNAQGSLMGLQNAVFAKK